LEEAEGGKLPIQQAALAKGVKEVPTVSEVIASKAVTIDSWASIVDAAKRMAQHELDHILVVEGNQLVGIISEADIRSDEGPLG
jgi:CBS domain-containing protein